MGLQRANSVKVADVVIPKRLLSTTKKNAEWSPRRRGEEVLESDGPVQEAIRNPRRPLSVIGSAILDGPISPTVATIKRPRKTSDPITLQEAFSVRSSCLTTLDDLTKSKPSAPKRVSFVPPRSPYKHEPQSSFSSYNTASDASSTYSYDHQVPQRSGTVRTIVNAVVPDAVQQTARNVVNRVRRNSIHEVYEKAKTRGVELERKRWVQILFEYSIYVLLLSFIYFVLIGMPLWRGAVYWLYWVVQNKFVITGGWSITLGIAFFYAFGPLLILFEKEPPMIERAADFDRNEIPGVATTALLIPCYKSANIIGPTLDAALKVFPASHIFVIANGNSETPLDNTEEVCRPYGVNHIWSPVGSKIVAQFVGCYAAKGFKNVLLIDDDCALPPNFPVVSERLSGKVKSIGYTIKSVGPNSSKGSWCQQAQDLEYKISGLQRALAGKMGSATFPHGAISLWNRKFLIKTFHDHPGFSVSEDWFFGHSCRRLGGRIKMCTSVFVETETPDAVFFSSGGSRGGFGEMTVFKQRFLRWNFFFVNGMWYNLHYIFCSWKLGWWELGAKLFVFQEVYETLLYLFTPFILPISFYVRPDFCGYLLAATIGLYLINVIIFNEVHLRLRKERLGWTMLLVYYMPYKFVLTLINVGSCYWSLYKYARYFAKRHPKVIEDEKAVEVVMRLEEAIPDQEDGEQGGKEADADGEGGRRMFVTAVTSRNNNPHAPREAYKESEGGWTKRPNQRLSFVPGLEDHIPSTIEQPEAAYGGHWSEDEEDLDKPEPLHASRKRTSFLNSFAYKTRGPRTSWSQSPV